MPTKWILSLSLSVYLFALATVSVSYATEIPKKEVNAMEAEMEAEIDQMEADIENLEKKERVANVQPYSFEPGAREMKEDGIDTGSAVDYELAEPEYIEVEQPELQATKHYKKNRAKPKVTPQPKVALRLKSPYRTTKTKKKARVGRTLKARVGIKQLNQ